MIAEQENHQLDRCRRLIEDKLGWGPSADWTSQDFDRLAEQIANQTGVALSSTTLKRVWGRVKYDSAPTTTTLNALAGFLNYPTWRDFLLTQLPPVSNPIQLDPLEKKRLSVWIKKKLMGSVWGWLGAGTAIGLLGVLLFSGNRSDPKPLASELFSFESHPVTKGLPNSVVFHYDATAAPTDSIFIQQTWDPARRQLVSKANHEYTSMYYYPGYFQAKLVVGKQVVRQHDLLIPTDGWLGMVEQESSPIPTYFSLNKTRQSGILHIPIEAMKAQNIEFPSKAPFIQYLNVRDFSGLRNDNFTFETRLKADYNQGTAVCQHVQIDIFGRSDWLLIPLCAKGCVGELKGFLAGKAFNATTSDLSGLGADLSQWVDVRCEVRNKHVRVYVGGKKAYEATFPDASTQIIGLSYAFQGTGSVDFCRLSRANGEVVFEDNFDVNPTDAPSVAKK